MNIKANEYEPLYMEEPNPLGPTNYTGSNTESSSNKLSADFIKIKPSGFSA